MRRKMTLLADGIYWVRVVRTGEIQLGELLSDKTWGLIENAEHAQDPGDWEIQVLSDEIIRPPQNAKALM